MISFLLFLASCAHHRDVRPGVDGTNYVITRGPEKDQVERSAISQAHHYCESLEKRAAFVTEGTKYTGDMDEATRKTVRQASKAAVVVGSGMYGLGGRNERSAGGAVGTAGTVGAIMTGGDAYTSEMKFKCQ
ncbi:MAG: hypothetical protein AB7F59_05110 [Bdellovibrionales bacterium]